MSDSDFDPTRPDDQPKRSTDEMSRSELDKETSEIERPKLAGKDEPKVETDKTVLAGPGEDIVPGYQLLSKLGEGGMGVVYKALQRSLNREVALKVMKTMGDDESFVARFRREAITGARVNHPNIVGVYDHGKHQGSVYLVLEYVKGKNCAELLDKDGPFAIETALRITRCAVLGLSHAHNEGVIHRDIKPANIMVVDSESRDARGSGRLNAKVADFGLARLHDGSNDPDHQDLTQTGSVMGTPGYMAPEQALGKPVDFRADIYSLGSTLYCLLTGTKPFKGNTVIEVLHKKINDFALDPRDLIGDVSEGIIRVLDRMMAKNADDRYQSYENLLHDLEKVLAGEEPDTAPVEAHSRSLAPPAGKTIAVPQQKKRKPFDSRQAKPTAEGSSKKGLIMAGAGIVIVGAVAGFVLFGSKKDEVTPETKNPVASLEQQIADWDRLPPDEFIDRAGTHWDQLKARSAELKESDATSLRESFRKIAQADLKAVLPGKLEALETYWNSRDWNSLYESATSLVVAQNLAGEIANNRVAQLASFASQALEPGQADAEEKTAKALASRPDAELDELKSFAGNFPFSPALSGIETRIENLEKRQNALSGLKAELTALRQKDETEFFEDGARVALATRIDALKDETEKAALRQELAGVATEKARGYLALKKDHLDSTFRAREFATLRHEVDALQKLLKSLQLDEPAWLVAHASRVKLATADKALLEKDAFEGIEASKDPAIRIALIEDYLKNFADFSPSVEQLKTWRDEALAQAPYFEFEVEPASARVKVNDKAIPGNQFKKPLEKGTVAITAEADGFFPRQWEVAHEGETPSRTFRLIRKPKADLKVTGTYNIAQLLSETGLSRFGFGTAGVEAVEAPGGVGFKRNEGKQGFAVLSCPFNFTHPNPRVSPFKPGQFKGWQLRGRIDRLAGVSELRILESNEGYLVIGLEEKSYYLGLRLGEKLDKRFELPYETAETAVRFALEWDGQVALLRVTPGPDSLGADPDIEGRPVASVKLNREGSMQSDLDLAIGTAASATFRDFELYPLN